MKQMFLPLSLCSARVLERVDVPCAFDGDDESTGCPWCGFPPSSHHLSWAGPHNKTTSNTYPGLRVPQKPHEFVSFHCYKILGVFVFILILQIRKLRHREAK